MPNEETIQKMSIVDPIQVNVNIPNFEGKPGKDGTNGRDGDDAYRIAVRNGFLGTEKEWLLTLKGQDGKSASAPTARQALLKNNVWCEDDTVDSVFNAIIGNWGKPMPRVGYEPLTVPIGIQGQEVFVLTGEPHYSVKVQNTEKVYTIDQNGSCQLKTSPLGDSDIILEYYNFLMEKIGTSKINGVQTGGTPDKEETINGNVYKLFGNTLRINVTNNTTSNNNLFDFIPPTWDKTTIGTIMIKSDTQTTLMCGDRYAFDSDHNTILPNYGTKIYVENPENVSFKTNHGHYMDNTLDIGTLADGTKRAKFTLSDLRWDANTKTYINTGDYMDSL